MTPEPTVKEIFDSLSSILKIEGEEIYVEDLKKFRDKHLDGIVFHSVFHSEPETRLFLRWLIRKLAVKAGVVPASISPFYKLKGEGKFQKITVPAVNIRGLTYDTGRALVRAAMAGNARAFLFEIARSEMGYTDQRPGEYAEVLIAAALREGFSGPLFIQGDHFQFNAKRFAADPQKETEELKQLIRESIEAGFYNIDIDASTLVDLKAATLEEQQKMNAVKTAEMTRWIRSLEPAGISVSVGGEIGEVGGKNSTVDELRAFLDGYLTELKGDGNECEGLSKVSVQTGTSHGGVPLPDGTVAEVAIDFEVLKELSKVAIEGYHLAGAVQHGASTLPETAFGRFPETNTAEVHLATSFQNFLYDSKILPKSLTDEMLAFCKKEFASERKPDDTDEQFLYKTRKKAFGPFKRKLWELPEEVRCSFRAGLQKKFEFLFKQLNAKSTFDGIVDNVEPVKVCTPPPEKYRQLIM